MARMQGVYLSAFICWSTVCHSALLASYCVGNQADRQVRCECRVHMTHTLHCLELVSSWLFPEWNTFKWIFIWQWKFKHIGTSTVSKQAKRHGTTEREAGQGWYVILRGTTGSHRSETSGPQRQRDNKEAPFFFSTLVFVSLWALI